MSATDLLTEPELDQDQGTDPGSLAHIVNQNLPGNDITTAVVTGDEVTALCGHRFVPYNDPQGKPVCAECIEAYGQIRK